MFGRILLGVAAILLVIALLKWFVRSPPATVKRFLLSLGIVLIIAGLGYLAATGRLHWLYALGAALIPLVRRLLPLVRYVPLLRGLYARYKAARGPSAAAGRSSQVESRFLRMSLDHDTGTLDGEIRAGMHTGARLSELSMEQLIQLLKQYRLEDGDSARLLQSYLERVHGERWRDGFAEEEGAQSQTADTSGPMSREEALQILGLEGDTDREAIIEAHRRLMQKLHPDRGGSDYLAAKINKAKDVLLGK